MADPSLSALRVRAEQVARLLQAHEDALLLGTTLRERIRYRAEYDLDDPEDYENDIGHIAMKAFSAARVCLDAQADLLAAPAAVEQEREKEKEQKNDDETCPSP